MLTDDAILTQVRDAFYAEQAEHCQAASELLLELERGPNPTRRHVLLNELFRQAHSMKGGARAANLPELEQIAHAIEDLFSVARANTLELTPEVCDPIYAALDAIGVLARQSAAHQLINLGPYQPLLDQLAAACEDAESAPILTPSKNGNGHARPKEYGPQAALTIDLPNMVQIDTPAPVGEEPALPIARPEYLDTTVRLSTTILDGLLNETGELLTYAVRARIRAHEAQVLADLPVRWRRLWRQAAPILSRSRQAAPFSSPTVHYLDTPQGQAMQMSASYAPSSAHHDLARLAAIMDQAHALISEIGQQFGAHARRLADDHDHLANLTERLHDQVWRTRLLPVATLLPALRLQLREMTRSLGKQINLVCDDGGSAADRQVLDQLREVLMHLLRNAVDHGIEDPSVRLAQGKPVQGTIRLTAAVRGEQLALTIQDDGAGLDEETIRRTALSRGLLSATDASQIDTATLLDLIFRPGFSTRTQADALSGRGVGLDIVRTQVERMRGEVTVDSVPGQSCVFTIVVPLSLASSAGLWLQAGPNTFIVPLEHIRQIVTIAPQSVRLLEGRPVCLVHGRPLELVSLAALLDMPGTAGRGMSQPGSIGVVLGNGERQIVLQVDAVLGERTLIVQRLPTPLMRVRFVGGATILEDGQVVPVLDVVDVLHYTLSLRSVTTLAPVPDAIPCRTILVVDDSITTRTLEKNILQAAGYHVVLATNGQEGLATLTQLMEHGSCDLVLSDVDMPVLNGYDLTSRVRADDRLRHLPIVLVTSLDTPDQRARGVAAGADAYIIKRTFDQQVLLNTIERLLGQD